MDLKSKSLQIQIPSNPNPLLKSIPFHSHKTNAPLVYNTVGSSIRADFYADNSPECENTLLAIQSRSLDCFSENLEWKLTYVGSAEDETYDQVLESVLVGPINVGNYRFVFEADPPDALKIREEDIIGVTVLLLTCSYLGQEFVRVGYYVNNDYEDEHLREEPPHKVLMDKVQRNILADKPRVTKFPINFHPENLEQSNDVPEEIATEQEQPVSSPNHASETLLDQEVNPANCETKSDHLPAMTGLDVN
ncbi:hypothetical protein OSB04_021504 [Centaurea solstitialis]|uniref:Uncharacterized protein n=1 Tax=Centaurea solstitialis TaxID=347529 RepID=A0AA38WHU0_9ASTR|nr:hypothetical protein OSB04_021504 [Centaurea solstitialis]